MSEPVLIFERTQPDRRGTCVRARDAKPSQPYRLPDELARVEPLPLPEVGELGLVRHYIELSRKSFGVDTGFYPLGSCTMKYNPKSTEAVAAMPGFMCAHPTQPAGSVPGFLKLMFELQEWLAEITGMDAMSLQPAAGAHGELAGMLMFRRYFESRGEVSRRVMLVPDSAHGTNPASAILSGFSVAEINVRETGGIVTPASIKEAITKHCADSIAGIMLTNPSTLGTFEEHIEAISTQLHEIGAQLYYDGANLNALLGLARPGDMGFDLVHLNLHKTFSTPHGGGGPGSGPIGVKAHLADYLPSPIVVQGENGVEYTWSAPSDSIGRMKLYHGQFLVLVRTWAYILLNGPTGLRRVAEHAIIAANYLQARLRKAYDIPYGDKPCMHEFVASASRQKQHGISAFDIAKALLNDGFHAPTAYFPLIVDEALMIEPTETESLETLDAFADAMLRYAELAESDPDKLKALPNLNVTHLDEVWAARNLNVRWVPAEQVG